MSLSSSSSTAHLPPFLLTSPPPVPPPSKLRLEALYASTSAQRLSNPTGYASNVEWWAEVLTETLRSGWLGGSSAAAGGKQDADGKLGEGSRAGGRAGGDRLVLRADEGMVARLAGAAGERPKGLGGVLEDQASRNPPVFHPLAHFYSSPTPLHAPPSLTYRLVGRPLSWAVHQVNPFASDQPKAEKEEVLWKRYGAGKEYVCMPLLERSAALFTAWLNDNPILSYSDSLFSPASFQRKFGKALFPRGTRNLPEGPHELSQRDCDVLLKWLERDCRAVVRDVDVVKVLQPGQTALDAPVVEADRDTLILLETLSKIDTQVAELSAQITAFQLKAKSALSVGQKPLALSFLRSKKAVEEVLDKRLNTQEQLRAVLRRIDQASDDVELMEAYEAATGALRAIHKNPRLGLERVEGTLDELAGAMEHAEEVGRAVRAGEGAVGRATGEQVDEEELAKELEDMVLEEKGRAQVQKSEAGKAQETKPEKQPLAGGAEEREADHAQSDIERRLEALKKPQEEIQESRAPEREKQAAE